MRTMIVLALALCLLAWLLSRHDETPQCDASPLLQGTVYACSHYDHGVER